MSTISPSTIRLLALAPSTRGFGYALFEGQKTIIDWGVKTVRGDKNPGCLAKVEELITHYQPGAIVLEDSNAEKSRRSPRIRELDRQITALASSHSITVVLFPRGVIRQAYFADGKGTKHAMAQIIAEWLPEELAARLPAKRRAWESEPYQMDIFNAVALGFTYWLPKESDDFTII